MPAGPTVSGMKRTALITASAAAAILLLASCASLADPADEIAAAPATGETVEGDGYSYAVPEGWGVPEGVELDTQGLDTIAADLRDADGFSDNINALLSPAGLITIDQAEEQGVRELEDGGATDVEVEDRVRVADTDAARISASLTQSGISYNLEQYYISNDDQTYIVTFSFSDTVDDDQRTETAESVLATWSWQ